MSIETVLLWFIGITLVLSIVVKEWEKYEIKKARDAKYSRQ